MKKLQKGLNFVIDKLTNSIENSKSGDSFIGTEKNYEEKWLEIQLESRI